MMQFVRVALLAVVCTGGPLAWAQNEAYPLKKLTIEGEDQFPEAAIAEATGLALESPVTEDDFKQALIRLQDLGAFHSLAYSFAGFANGYHLTLTVEEMEEFYPLRLEGFDKTEAEMRAYLAGRIPLIGERIAFAEPYKDWIGRELNAYWRAAGKEEPVIGHMRPVGEDDFEIVFQPEKTVETIAFTKFENTGAVRVYDAQRRFLSSARGVPYSEPRLLELLRFNAAPMWHDLGYLEVSFCPCTTEPDPDSAGLLVTIPVEQGEPYTFGGFSFTELFGVEPERIQQLWIPDTGDVANLSLIDDSFVELNRYLRTKGFLDSFAAYEKHLNPDEKTVDIEVQITQGTQYAFEGLVIRGLDIIGEPAVRKRWGMKRGEPFDASYPGLFLQRIEAEQMFENLKGTKSNIRLDHERHLATVELVFE